MSKFEVGDRVRLTEKGFKNLSEVNHTVPKNGEGTIVKLYSPKMNNRFDFSVKFDNYKEYDDLAIEEGEIELIDNESLAPLPWEVEEKAVEFKGAITGTVVFNDLGKFETKGKELGAVVDSKEKAYGSSVAQTFELMKIFLAKYRNEDGDYIISEDLLKQILLQVRIIDKQNRIFNNPSQDLMEENTYNDLVGYSLIGGDLTGR